MKTPPLLCIALLACAMEPEAIVDTSARDRDGDGYYAYEDCDDTDAALHPGDTDADGYSSCDGDCDDRDPYRTPGDEDGDGISSCDDDCDDSDPHTWPGAAARDSATACTRDADGDGYGSPEKDQVWEPGSDCDDDDAAVHPGAEETWYDGVDANCDGLNDYDQDGDGYDSDQHGGDDCDDEDADMVPEDTDGDGYSACDGDCDETDGAIHPEAKDSWYDGIDSNCDGLDDYDQDGDGGQAEAYGGPDCDDEDPAMNATDVDGDGWSLCDKDCDDEDAQDFPGAHHDHQGLSMTCVADGSFTMGAPEDEVGRDGDEDQHEVTLTRAFWIAVYEVTQDQFLQHMGYNPSSFADAGEDRPVEGLDWHEAALFANVVSAAAGLEPCYDCYGKGSVTECVTESVYADPYSCPGYRLPTEAEWEYAARAGQEASFSSGGDLIEGDDVNCDGGLTLNDGSLLDEQGWYCGNAAESSQLVGQLAPNAWGLYDVHGNVWEWCHDWWADYSGDVTDPWGPDTAKQRVRKGGSWSNNPRALRFADRSGDSPWTSADELGLRLARTR